MSGASREVSDTAHDAARGRVAYLTKLLPSPSAFRRASLVAFLARSVVSH